MRNFDRMSTTQRAAIAASPNVTIEELMTLMKLKDRDNKIKDAIINNPNVPEDVMVQFVRLNENHTGILQQIAYNCKFPKVLKELANNTNTRVRLALRENPYVTK